MKYGNNYFLVLWNLETFHLGGTELVDCGLSYDLS